MSDKDKIREYVKAIMARGNFNGRWGKGTDEEYAEFATNEITQLLLEEQLSEVNWAIRRKDEPDYLKKRKTDLEAALKENK